MGAAYSNAKIAADRIAAALLLFLLLPLILAISAAIRIDTKGPAIYRQKRVGKDGRIFTMYKFRTMVDCAERETGPVLSGNGDKRITRAGVFLRKAGLDEIPQLLNVAKGEMCIIGPRPERKCFSERFSREVQGWEKRLGIMPGITGLSQVKGIGSLEPRKKLHHDLMYINRQSFLTDMAILLQTALVVLRIRKNNGRKN